MSLHTSLLAVEGDHLDRIDEVIERFDYRLRRPPSEASWDDANEALADGMHKAACFVDGWTVVVDPELVLMNLDEECRGLSRSLDARVLGALCEGVSASYGFRVFQGGELVRGLGWVDGEVTEDEGASMPEEGAIDPRHAGEQDVIDVLAALGVRYEALESVERFLVLDLSEDEAPEHVSTRDASPWWRFWRR